MKIKYVVFARIPTDRAHGYQITKMCEEFARLGHDVELIVPNRHNNISDDAYSYYGLEKNFIITKLPAWYFGFSSFLSFSLERLSFLWSVKSYLKRQDYDILYVRDEFIGLFFSDYYLELHTISEKRTYWYRRMLRCASKIFALTSAMREDLINDFDIQNENILVSPDGVDIGKIDLGFSRETARQKLGLSIKQKMILYLGHLYEWKGAQTLADASVLLQDSVVYFVGGTKWDLASFAERNKNQIDDGKMVLVGYRSRTEVPLWFAAADMLVIPNSGHKKISVRYTSPLKLFEYMAAERPIASSDLPSLREILNESNAVFFEPDNPKSLAEVIDRVLRDRGLGARIAKQARVDVEQYTWQKRAERIINFIKVRKVKSP